MSGNFFRGTTHDQDARYNNVEKKLLSKMSFAKVLSTKVGLDGVRSYIYGLMCMRVY